VVGAHGHRPGVRRPTHKFSVRGVQPVWGVCTAVNSVLHPDIRVRAVTRPRNPVRISYSVEFSSPGAKFGVHNNSVQNLKRGLNERVFYRDAKHTECVLPIENAFSKMAPFDSALKSFRVQAWTMEQVVESYSGRQRTRYQQALDSLRQKPFSRDDAIVATFLKAEKINFSVKVDPAPRVIQPRDPRFNLLFAQYIKPAEHLIYKALGKLYKYPCVAKGFNAAQTGDIIHRKWSLFKTPVAISLDASRFDQHVSVDALKYTHSVYRKFIKGDDLERCLNLMYVNKGRASCKDGFLTYKKRGSRMSGDMDTALGNCVLMVAMTYSLCNTLGIRHEVMDNGDDITVFMEDVDRSRFLNAVPSWYSSLGFDMKVEGVVNVLEEVEFCQTKPVHRGDQYVMVRLLTSLNKDLTTLVSPETVGAWFRAIGECGLALTDGMPLYGAYYKWMCRMGDSSNMRLHPLWRCGMVNLTHNMYYTGKGVCDIARHSFHKAFGLSPYRQQLLEFEFDNLGTPALGKDIINIKEFSQPDHDYYKPEY